MDPQKHKQMVSMMFAASAKSEEDISKMTPEERKTYLQSRLKQKLNINSLQRQNSYQKTKIQEKLQEKVAENSEVKAEVKPGKNAKKNAKKREKEKAKKVLSEIVTEEKITEVKSDDGSESDYSSDKE